MGLVHDETPRSTWKLAVVESLIEGGDGLTQAANIRTSTGHTNRPITKLYPLEVCANEATEDDTSEQAIMFLLQVSTDLGELRPWRQCGEWLTGQRIFMPPPEDVE